MKIYEKNWFIALMFIGLPPIGIFLIWKYKKLNKFLRILLTVVFSIVTLFYVIVYAALSDDTTDTPDNSASVSQSEDVLEGSSDLTTENQTESNSDETTSYNFENPLMSATICEAPVMNGTGTEQIGSYGYVNVTSDEFESLTPKNFAEFAKEKVKDSGYNWFAISIISEKTFRVLWAGCYIGTVDFGTWDKDGNAIGDVETWELVDDTYVKLEEETEPATETTTKEHLSSYVANKSTKKFHQSTCYMVDKMDESNKKDFECSYDDMIAKGYSPCKKCF